jgi:hypothetical protein
MIYKKLLLLGFIPLFIFQGCGDRTPPGKSKLSCSDSSNIKLDAKNVEDIDLTSPNKNHSGTAANNQSKGYKFVGQKGQKISYQIKPNGFCTWLYSSDNKTLNDPILPQDGTYIIQVAAAENSGTFDITISLGGDSSPPPSPPSPNPQSPSPNLQSPSPNPQSPSPPLALTKEEATNIIRKWLEAKKSIFGSSYNKDIGKELTIGQAYERNITAKPGQEESSVDYFQRRGEYYTYEYQEVHDILSIQPKSSNNETFLVKALVSEDRTLHGSNGSSKQRNNRSSSCYLLQKDGNSWKIAKDPSILSCKGS